ncbi:TNF receptor-associated factor 3 [Anopheles moucheti]|uniref:TNF receptor-associated factor 3 n=1 Tax=Anopheles moucheti TaxID=186751 RepID=UPI0022F05D2B|nr:TNF receptor-associated factor 3 [Anopheles moucheti]
MERATVKGRVKYSKTSCYLCSEWLDDNAVEKHLLYCRQQQIVCPNRCGAIVQHKTLQLHLNSCRASYGEPKTSKNIHKTTARTSNTMSQNEQNDETIVNDVLTVEDLIFSLEKSIREIRYAISGINFRMYYVEERVDGLAKACNGLSAKLCEIAATGGEEINQELEDIKAKLSRLAISPSLGNIIGGSETSPKPVEDARAPAELAIYETKIKELEQQVLKYRQENYYTKKRVDDIQSHLKMAYYQAGLASQNGRIIWRINEFAKCLADAKEFGVMMRGPIFSHTQNGYILQVEVGLDGIGNWRGRNMVIGVVVQPGPYDTLLKWPCRLNATLILHDQADDREHRKNIIKPLVVKQKLEAERSKQYVHIAHETLRGCSYVRDDCLMLEVIIESEVGSSSK